MDSREEQGQPLLIDALTHIMTRSAATKIGLLGPYGSNNLGDVAIQEAVISRIKRQWPNAEIVGFSPDPDDTERTHRIRSFPLGPRSTHPNASRPPGSAGRVSARSLPRRIADRTLHDLRRLRREILFILRSYKFLKGFDLLIASGGGQLDDFWGGAWGHPYALLRWALIAKAAGTRLAVLSVGVCDIQSRLTRLFITQALKLAAYRSFRDADSKTLVESLGVDGEKRQNHVFPDLAYSLDVPSRRLAKAWSPGRRVAISPISARAWTSEPDPVSHTRYLQHLAQLGAWLIGKGYTVVIFPSQISMDGPVAERLIAILRGSPDVPEERLIHAAVSSLDDLLCSIASADIVIASRLHGVLLSHVLCKPVLALSYHRKVDVLMRDMEQTEYCLRLQDLEQDPLRKTFTLLETDAPAVTAQIRAKVSAFRSELEQQYVSIFNK